MKKIFIRSFGCQMNKLDTGLFTTALQDAGFGLSDSVKQADVVLINTCSVRDHAENRSLSFAGSLRKLRKGRTKRQSHASLLRSEPCALTSEPVIGLIGCMARNRGEEIFKKMPHVSSLCVRWNRDDILLCIVQPRRVSLGLPVVSGGRQDK